MYDVGSEKLDKEFDIVNIVQNLRNLTIFLKNTLKTDSSSRAIVENSRRNFIMLDSSDENKTQMEIDREDSDFSFEHQDSQDLDENYVIEQLTDREENIGIGLSRTVSKTDMRLNDIFDDNMDPI